MLERVFKPDADLGIDKPADVLIFNSCLWDVRGSPSVTRYYQGNCKTFVKELARRIPATTLFLFYTSPKGGEKVSGALLEAGGAHGQEVAVRLEMYHKELWKAVKSDPILPRRAECGLADFFNISRELELPKWYLLVS